MTGTQPPTPTPPTPPTQPRDVRRCGDRALLVEDDDPAALASAAAALPDVVETVPGARTVLVRHGRDTDVRALATALATLAAPPLQPFSVLEVVVPVRYDGDDLDGVAELTGLDPREVVALHTDASYEVAFCGFAPGFAYLRGLDPRLRVPRLASPRTRVPPGSVAVADTWTAVYPRESPGGWRLLGRTTLPLWDVEAATPALLAPGTRVRFVEEP